jgi:hypothetical protein
MTRKSIYRIGSAAIALTMALIGGARAASFDGSWNVVVYTTNGHCGVSAWQVGINGGQLNSTGAMLGGYPAALGGVVSPSGQLRLNGVAGPRTARGSGRLLTNQGSGTWSGVGPSGTCSGVWNATRY